MLGLVGLDSVILAFTVSVVNYKKTLKKNS